MITINTNTTAMVAQNNLTTTQGNLNGSMLKLSTGLRINSASDDAAGMQISNRMETQVNGLGVAQRNANDAISMAQTAEGAMVEVTDMLNRMRDLSLQSANDSNTADDRAAMQKEVDALKSEITRVNETTNFAGTKLLNGDAANLSFQVGSNANETIGISVKEISTSKLVGEITEYKETAVAAYSVPTAIEAVTIGDESFSLAISTSLADAVTELNKNTSGVTFSDNAGKLEATAGKDVTVTGMTLSDLAETKHNDSVANIDLSSAKSAQEATQVLDGALKSVDDQRANLGAVQNRLESTIDNLGNIEQNMTASQSRIKDVDFAKETTNMTSQQMMMQAGSTVLSQAKQMPQYAAQLMG